jgi:DNA-binding MarR family transcriptional regulator
MIARTSTDRLRYDVRMPIDTTSERQQRPSPAISARDPRLSAWRALLTAHTRLVDRLDQDLRVEAGMSLADYSALLHLAEAPQRRLRMSQLAEGIFLTRSGVTRLVDRLQADGLVTRSHCPSDGRGAEAVLTEAGFERLRSASPIHLRGIKAYFLDQVAETDLQVLERMMGAVAVNLAPGTAAAEA